MNKVQAPRLEALQDLADHYGSDPYSLSLKARKRFREVKKVEKAQEAADAQVKGRYGLPEDLKLAAETDDLREEAREEWSKARAALVARESGKRRFDPIGLTSRTSSSSRSAGASSSRHPNAVDLLRSRILSNTARRKPPDSSTLRRA